MKCYSGMDYLRIDIAGQFGLDKEEFEPRIAWVHAHENELESLVNDADDAYRYAAAVMAYRQTQRKEPTGHLVGLDACASGPEILSVVTGCKTGAYNTGATGQTRKDVYGIVTSTMNNLLEEAVDYDRDTVKNAFMTVFYGSKQEPIKAFGADTPELDAFYTATNMICPGATQLISIIGDLWDPTALSYSWDLPDGFHVLCKVKDTVDIKIEIDTLEHHPVFQYRHKINTNLEKGKFLQANVTHSIDGFLCRELTARCDYNIGQLRSAELLLIKRLQKEDNSFDESLMLYSEKMTRKHHLISIEGVEFINDWSVNYTSKTYATALLNLIRMVLQKPSFKVVSIHDEFKCLANYMNYLRQVYINLLAELADSEILSCILSDIAGSPMHIPKLSSDLAEEIRKAEYPLA